MIWIDAPYEEYAIRNMYRASILMPYIFLSLTLCIGSMSSIILITDIICINVKTLGLTDETINLFKERVCAVRILYNSLFFFYYYYLFHFSVYIES